MELMDVLRHLRNISFALGSSTLGQITVTPVRLVSSVIARTIVSA